MIQIEVRMKIGIAGILQNPSTRQSSHNAGWTYVYKSMLQNLYGLKIDVLTNKDDWNNYEEIWINEGVNYRSGIWNLYGGVSDELIERLYKLKEYKNRLFFWGDEAPNYVDLCEKRNIDIRPYNEIKSVKQIINSNKLVLGDSHSISVYNSGWHISRNDGKTLYSFTKEDDSYWSNLYSKYQVIRFYAGNIDIRHHLCRIYETIDLYEHIEDLVLQLKNRLSFFSHVEVVEPLRNCSDTRKIPKTGYYSGKPFWGSLEDREEARSILSMYINKHFENVLKWPESYHDENNLLRFDVMESKQSVHLSPNSYMFANEYVY